MKGMILAVDPGDKRIGLAVSDPEQVLARPLRVLEHVSRALDAAQIAALAGELGAVLIVVGQSLDDEGLPTPEGRKAGRLAEAVRGQTNLRVELWDESFSTQDARQQRIARGAARNKRIGHMDDLAAAMILQSYLDSHPAEPQKSGEEEKQ